MISGMSRRGLFGTSALAGALALSIAGTAVAQERVYSIPAQSLAASLRDYGIASGEQIIFAETIVSGRQAPPLQGAYDSDQALRLLLADTGLVAERVASGGVMIRKVNQDPQGGSAAGAGAEVEALIVTAQKREEDIQDVPIAISAFTQEQLDRSQVAGGPDLMTQVPNMTFTKTNFTSYSIQLRGIGTQAISATVDHAVAVAFNNTPFIRNRFFEQEFYDLQRVEVLRGPQGTLYGRNATAGVVNLISNKPKLGTYEARVSGDIANYNSSRIEGMLNIPLAEDVASLRLAGAWTKREGYATNEITGNPIDGRDLWSTRVSLRFSPTDRLDANLIWEHFEENDDRIRSGKQLCKTHEVTSITAIYPEGTLPTQVFQTTHDQILPELGLPTPLQGTFSQGCEAASLYSPDSFQMPNGYSLPFYEALSALGLPIALDDPYVNSVQSRDLRVIESVVDPSYKAETDVVELQLSYDLTDTLTLTSETGYSSDFIFSTQDYNRFNTASGAWSTTSVFGQNYIDMGILTPDGFFCDPQIGCADRLVAMDLSTATSRHFSQELRIGSSFDGMFNFSLGANFLRYDTEDKYYVFINSLTMYAASRNGNIPPPYVPNVTDNRTCLENGFTEPDPNGSGVLGRCEYIDPNPIGNLNDLGHNYFLSKNPYKLISYAIFGESYFQFTEALKLTAGFRWTVDQKEAPRIPSWVLANNTAGYPVAEVVEQEWNEPTGRLTIDWKPDLAFTDETMVYASYAHGYKAGGMNPPAAALVCYAGCGNYAEDWNARFAAKPKTFEAEYVDAFELGAKNTLLDGRLTLNTAAFYYDYQGYQLSQIVDRAAITQNFDATVWGLEIEADWRPLENLRLGFKGGYENTKVGDGMRAIDVMDRTAGTPGWVVVSPFPTFPSNCVLPAYIYAGNAGYFNGASGDVNELIPINVGNPGGGAEGGCELAYLYGVDPVTRLPYVENPTVELGNPPTPTALLSRPGYPGFNPLDESVFQHNRGEGFFKDLSGNELPNAPDFTATITADYTTPLPNDWLATLHTDLYYQSEAWTRIFNTEGYDKLKAYTNVNLAAIFTNEEAGWKVMAYVKNVFDRDSITGAFLNSDDTGLTTNVFLTDPRLYGLRVTKEWNGGPWWTGANLSHQGPYPLTIEIGGQVQRQEAPYEKLHSGAFDQLPDGLNVLGDIQNRDLDWGDGRSIRVTYRPDGAPWSISGGMRYGRTNNDTTRQHTSYPELRQSCIFPLDHILSTIFCNPSSPKYNPAAVNVELPSYADTSGRDREEHTIVDFEVGYDVALGSLVTNSRVGVGLRYAEFNSTSMAQGDARGGWIVEPGFGYNGFDVYQTEVLLSAEREFSGLGPTLTWDAALALLGNDQTGHLTLDWQVSGGVLFGERDTVIEGLDTVRLTTGFADNGTGAPGTGFPFATVGTPTAFAVPGGRTSDATVPLADISLGLAYEVGRIKVGAGYRWERYFDVLDVGYGEEQSDDRTIDGPYFKLAVGFGG